MNRDELIDRIRAALSVLNEALEDAQEMGQQFQVSTNYHTKSSKRDYTYFVDVVMTERLGG